MTSQPLIEQARIANAPPDAVLAVDGMNLLYETCRSLPDHVLYDEDPVEAVVDRLQAGLGGRRAVFVLDGRPPKAKQAVIRQRHVQRATARVEVQRHLERAETARNDAMAQGLPARRVEEIARPHVEAARRAAPRAVHISRPTARRVLARLRRLGHGLAYAPCEAEAQAAAWTRMGYAWAVVTRDFDALLYGAVRVAPTLALDRVQTQDDVLRRFDAWSLREVVGAAVVSGATDYAPPLAERPCSIRRAVWWLREAGGFANLVYREAFERDPLVWFRARDLYLHPQVSDAPPPLIVQGHVPARSFPALSSCA